MGQMRILLLMLLPIGDTLFTTPAIHALRRRYPDAHITALVYPTNLGIVRSNPDIDDFLLWPTRQSWSGLLVMLRLLGHLRQRRFHLAIEFCNYIWWLTLLCGIRKRSEMNLPKMWWLLPAAGRSWRKKHAVEHYADVVRRLDIPVTDTSLRIHPSQEEIARAEAWLLKQGVGAGEKLIGIHLGGEGLWGRKRWSIHNFARVADRLAETQATRILVMGGKDEIKLADELEAQTATSVLIATGQTSLGETAVLASKCQLFIGNDSSPLHIAAASGTHVVGIYGPTDPRSYHPWIPRGREGVDYAIVRSSLPCACRFPLVGGITILGWLSCLICPALSTITPEQVLEAAQSILSGHASEINSQRSVLT
jgi:ADP-heptose:LPS heptosyltransferase